MFSETFVCDPEHDHFIGPTVPEGEAWELNTLWLRAGQAGMAEAMLGVVRGEQFVALKSQGPMMRGAALDWSGSVLLQEGDAPLYLVRGAAQDEQIACSATWRVLNVTGRSRAKGAKGGNSGSAKPTAKSDTSS